MIEILKSKTFERWFLNLKDRVGRARIQARIDRLIKGNPGDSKSVGNGVKELRIPHGPGYRVYFIQDGKTVIILLCGGDKSSQQKDIIQAKMLAKEWRLKQ